MHRTKKIKVDERFADLLDRLRLQLKKNGYNGSYREATALMCFYKGIAELEKDMDKELMTLRRLLEM